MESITETIREPVVSFALLLAVILMGPPIFERLRLPGLVGLLAAGVVLGQSGLNLLDSDSETMILLSDIGKIYLMFVAGLEIDLEQFRRTRNRSLTFGLATFLVPLVTGTAIGHLFGFGWNASILIGSLLASHTLLGYPIVSRLGVVGNEAITITIGATIFTDIGALLVLAICVGIDQGDFSAVGLLILLGSLAIYSATVLFGFDWAGKAYFRRTGDDEGNQFVFVLLAVFLAAVGAQLIGVEDIVGAFLAGLAVNDVLGDSPVKEKVEFIGAVLFIPIFFVDMGLLLDLGVFVQSIGSIGLTLTIIAGLLISKFIAAFIVKLLFRYNWHEGLVMWSLSTPQVAATLAATLVGFQAGILNEAVLNGVIVMMLVTSIVGPLVTQRTAVRLKPPVTDIVEVDDLFERELAALQTQSFTVVVPVYNPKTERYLIEMAAILAHHESGRIVPLAIASGRAHMDDPKLAKSFQRGERLLSRAMKQSKALELGVEAEPLLRIDDDIARGIVRASREQRARLIVMGWSQQTGLRARLFGNLIDSVFWASHCPVAVTRLFDSPLEVKRILVPLENLTAKAVRPVRFAQILSEENQAVVTLLHVCAPRTSTEQIDWMRSQLSHLVSHWSAQTQVEIQITPHEDVVQAILEAARQGDLIVLRSLRRRVGASGLEISDVTTKLVKQLTCSVVMLGEPHHIN